MTYRIPSRVANLAAVQYQYRAVHAAHSARRAVFAGAPSAAAAMARTAARFGFLALAGGLSVR
jgi:hypothetical protein